MPTRVPSTNTPPRPPLVAVVDDDPTIALIIVRILQQAGFRTIATETCAEALRNIKQQKPDLVLLDVSLPDGSGFDLCRQLQLEPSTGRIPIIFISGHDAVETKVLGFDAGGVDYLTKPVAGAEVLARVRTHLRIRQTSEQLAALQASRVRDLAQVQQTLMPQPADLPEARFQVELRQVLSAGGDFYNVAKVADGIFDYVVADASGHDLAASLWTSALKLLTDENASPIQTPLTAVRNLSSALHRLLPNGAFFTLIYSRINHNARRATVINAGHPPALLLNRGTSRIVHQTGDVIGPFDDAVFGVEELELAQGARLVLYSDGILECNGRSAREGIQLLAETCRAVAGLPLERFVSELTVSALGDNEPADDFVLMGIET